MITNEPSKYKVLPKEHIIYNISENALKDTVVVIHLHYEYFFETALSYIKNIPSEVSVLFTTSNKALEQPIKEFSSIRPNCRLIAKENRGRDISSFLVACRKEILKYKYFCFIHDKKEKNEYMKDDIREWLSSQYENILGSKELICNIIGSFEQDRLLGLLLPPQSFSENIAFAFTNNWANNFDNTNKLLKDLGVDIMIDKNNEPMAIGTVFWAKTSSLIQLLRYDWKYEDFPEEPLPDDGCISHAIERSIEYIALYNNYSSRWICNNQYSEQLMDNYHMLLSNAFNLLDDKLGIDTPKRLNNYYDMQTLFSMLSEKGKIYVYGAGKVGNKCIKSLRSMNIAADGFIVTTKNDQSNNKIPIYTIDELNLTDKDIIIVATSKMYWNEIFSLLSQYGISKTKIFAY